MLAVWISVKFRIFGWDLGFLKKQFAASYDGKNITFTEVTPYTDPPAGAKVLLNERGVLLSVNAVP